MSRGQISQRLFAGGNHSWSQGAQFPLAVHPHARTWQIVNVAFAKLTFDAVFLY